MVISLVLTIWCILISLATLYHVFSSIYQDVKAMQANAKPVKVDPYAPRYYSYELVVHPNGFQKLAPVYFVRLTNKR